MTVRGHRGAEGLSRFGERVRQLREKAGWSQERLATACGLDRTYISGIERGRRNTEILKQDQFAPVPVEEQVAIITASTRGFMDKVPVGKVKQFEKEFIELLRASHKNVLTNLQAGKFEDADVATIKAVAADLSARY